MRKATHSGNCQACSAHQKLPGGVLSKHGYTTQWGFFSGTCPGSDHQPIQVSCDFIVEMITRTQEIISKLKLDIVELESRETNKTWHYRYKRDEWSKKSGYSWEECEIINGNIIHKDGTSVPARRIAGVTGNTDIELCKYFNKSKADSLRREIKKREEYIVWQQERVDNWKPAPLTEIKSQR